MLRSFSPRRKFSFDLALHRSKEKKKESATDDAGFAAIVDGLNRSSEDPSGGRGRARARHADAGAGHDRVNEKYGTRR